MRPIFLVLLILTACHKKEVVKTPVFPVKVAPVTVKDIPIYRDYVGHVEPFVKVEVKAQVEGELTGYYFIEGDPVQTGDLIFTIDERPYVAQLEKATAALARSLANFQYAEDVVERNIPLVKENYVSKLQFDEYVTQKLSAEAAIEENEALIDEAKINISYCNIHAPIDGVTGVLKIQVGNLIENAGDSLITLNQITPTYVYFSVPQKDLPLIMKLHRQKALNLEAYLGDEGYFGVLDLIDNEVNDQTGSISMRGVFPNEKQMLWPGEFVSVRLNLETKKGATLVPSTAVSVGQKGKYVFVIDKDHTANLRWIKTGEIVGDMTVVEEGVNRGETIVISGQINLRDGIKVEIR